MQIAFAEYFGLRDITVMHTVVDTVSEPSHQDPGVNGANAISGMVEGLQVPQKEKKPAIAITEFGFVIKAPLCEGASLEKSMTSSPSMQQVWVIERPSIWSVRVLEAFIDWFPASFGEYLFGGNRASSPNRLDGLSTFPFLIPRTCGFDIISCGPIERR